MGAALVEIVKSKRLAYFPLRKAGNTSVRAALKELAEGPGDYRSTPDVPLSPITRFHARGCYKIVVVRDPVRRFLSAYGNRVHYHHDVTRQKFDRFVARRLGLARKPDIDEFVERFWLYYAVNDKIRRHFRSQRRYLGGDLGYFDKVYTLENLQELADDLSKLAGREVTLPRLQTGGPKFRFESLSRATQERILRITAPDYAFLKDYYTPPALA